MNNMNEAEWTEILARWNNRVVKQGLFLDVLNLNGPSQVSLSEIQVRSLVEIFGLQSLGFRQVHAEMFLAFLVDGIAIACSAVDAEGAYPPKKAYIRSVWIPEEDWGDGEPGSVSDIKTTIELHRPGCREMTVDDFSRFLGGLRVTFKRTGGTETEIDCVRFCNVDHLPPEARLSMWRKGGEA